MWMTKIKLFHRENSAGYSQFHFFFFFFCQNTSRLIWNGWVAITPNEMEINVLPLQRKRLKYLNCFLPCFNIACYLSAAGEVDASPDLSVFGGWAIFISWIMLGTQHPPVIPYKCHLWVWHSSSRPWSVFAGDSSSSNYCPKVYLFIWFCGLKEGVEEKEEEKTLMSILVWWWAILCWECLWGVCGKTCLDLL